MKKILVFAYLRNNLGDDLFVSELLNRYPNDRFYINVIKQEYGEPFKGYKNAIIQQVKKENFNQIEIDSYDGFVYIGGSIFMENGHVYNLDEGCYEFIKRTKELGKPFFYISSNYGPYKTKEYFNLSERNFENCADICFRDMYSYELFRKIPTIRYAPDVAFLYRIDKLEKKKDTVGISVIDLEIRDNIRKKEFEYINLLNNNITTYLQEGKKVYLFSFCRHEGDEKMLDKLFSLRENDFKEKRIEIVKYKDDIKKFINIYSQMEYMICARFHSLILSYIFEQKFYVLSYSKKIDNIIKELGLGEKYMTFENVHSKEMIELEDFNKVERKKLEELREKAEKQFEKLDEFML